MWALVPGVAFSVALLASPQASRAASPQGPAAATERAEQVPVWTERDALAAFQRSNPALASAESTEEEARGDLSQAALLPNPTLAVGASNLPLRANVTGSGNGGALTRNLVTSVEIDQPFEIGGKRRKRTAAARGALAEAALGRADALRTARAELLTAFWNAVHARERRSLAEVVARRYAETVRISRARYASNDISKLDLEKVELEGMRNENDLADAVAAEREAIADLLALVGPGAPRRVQVEGSLATDAPALDPDRVVQRARDLRPDLRAARQHVDTARAQLALAQSQAWPDVTAGVAWTHSRAIAAGDNPDALAVTVSVPLPLFNRNQGDVQRASASLTRAEHEQQALDARIATDVASAWARYAAAADKVARYDSGILQRADRALEVAERSYHAGDASLLQFLEAERTFVALRSDYLDTLFELRQAALQLTSAVGARRLGELT